MCVLAASRSGHRWVVARPRSITWKLPCSLPPRAHPFDTQLLADIMTTRSYEDPDGRLISIARTGGGGRTVFEKNGSWVAMYHDEYPPTSSAESCFRLPEGDRGSAEFCAASCLKMPSCRYFWT